MGAVSTKRDPTAAPGLRARIYWSLEPDASRIRGISPFNR
jgi:hypothetical protein